MQFFKQLFAVFVVVICGVAVVSAEPNYFRNGVEKNVVANSVTITRIILDSQNEVGTLAANDNRIGGYVLNVSTNAVDFGVGTSTQSISDAGGTLDAADATGDEDRFSFREGNAVYIGALYFTAYTNAMQTQAVYVVEFNR